MSGKLSLRVFISSPGDVAEERALAARVFRRLGTEFADAVALDVVLWEHEPLFAHAGFQEQIPLPSECDLVVSILWARLGTRLPANFAPEPGQRPPTGTEFEVQDALAAFQRRGRPHLLIYRKRTPPHLDMTSPEADERLRQFRQLDEFCRKTFYDATGAARVAHHGFHDGAEFERKLTEHVRKWIERELDRAGAQHVRLRWTQGSPFRGLQAFDAEHQDVYFGRSQAVGELVQRLRDIETAEPAATPPTRLLLIVGMSGNGKTSLVRAGLLPLLADRPVEGIASWFTLSLLPSHVDSAAPGHGMLGALAAAIARALPRSAAIGISVPQLAEALRDHPAAAAARIETYLGAEAVAHRSRPEQARLLVYVDQLEELFTLAAAGTDAATALRALAALAALPTVWVVATMRSDFAYRLEAFPEIMAHLRRSAPYALLPPRGDELADMIREPAAAAGLEFEERDGVSLDREILRDATANPESLPLVEYALEQLYQQRDGRTLRWDVYRPQNREGGLRGSLVAVAEDLLARSGDAADVLFRLVMRELASVGEDGSATRRYAPLAAFAPGSAERALIDRMVDTRLCVTDSQGVEPVVCLAHEALLQSWPRARTFLQKESVLLRLRDELQRDARTWESHHRADGWLATAPDKVASLKQLQREGLIPAGLVAEYADRSRRRGRRNARLRRAAIASIATLGILSVVAGLVAMRQRDRAVTEAATADRTTRFMVSLFRLADPGENRGNAVTVREVLDRGARDVGHGLEREPGVRADLLTAMGQAYTGLGLYEPAKQLLAQARTDQDATTVPADSKVRTLIAYGMVLDAAGNYDAAKPLLQRAVDLAAHELPADALLASEARDGLADVLTQLEQYAAAEQLCEDALLHDRKRGPDGRAILSQTLNTLGLARYADGRLADAEAPLREALQLRRETFGQRHALTAESLNNVGSLLYQMGRYADAGAMLAEALPVYRDVYGAEHPLIATILNNLGRSALMAGRVDDAIPSLAQALALLEKLKGPADDELVAPLNSLAMAYLYHGDTARARVDLTRALSIARAREHWLLDQVLVNAADLELADHRMEPARALLAESRQRLENRHPLAKEPAEVWRYAVWESVHAAELGAEAHRDEAVAAFTGARATLVERFGPRGFYVLRLDQRQAALASPRETRAAAARSRS